MREDSRRGAPRQARAAGGRTGAGRNRRGRGVRRRSWLATRAERLAGIVARALGDVLYRAEVGDIEDRTKAIRSGDGADPLTAAVEHVRAAGVVVVAAAGNKAGQVGDPRLDPQALTVGAADVSGKKPQVAAFSGSGKT